MEVFTPATFFHRKMSRFHATFLFIVIRFWGTKGEQKVPRKIFYFEILLSQVMEFCLTLNLNLKEILF